MTKRVSTLGGAWSADVSYAQASDEAAALDQPTHESDVDCFRCVA